jgi:predicted metal-dependent hydrolase
LELWSLFRRCKGREKKLRQWHEKVEHKNVAITVFTKLTCAEQIIVTSTAVYPRKLSTDKRERPFHKPVMPAYRYEAVGKW